VKFSQQPGSNPDDLPEHIREEARSFGGGARVLWGSHRSKNYSVDSTEKAYPRDGQPEARTTVIYQQQVKQSARHVISELRCSYWSPSATKPDIPTCQQAKNLVSNLKHHALYHLNEGNLCDLGDIDVETNVGAIGHTGGPGCLALLKLGIQSCIECLCGSADEPSPAFRIVGQVPGEAYGRSALNNLELTTEAGMFSGTGEVQGDRLAALWVLVLNSQGFVPANMQRRHFGELVSVNPQTGSPVIRACSPAHVDYSLLWGTGPNGAAAMAPALELVPGAGNAKKPLGAVMARSPGLFNADVKLEECPIRGWAIPRRLNSAATFTTRLEAHLATVASILRLGPFVMLKNQTDISYGRGEEFLLLGADGAALKSDDQVLLGDWLYRILAKLYGTLPFVVIAMAFLNHLVYGKEGVATRLGIKKEAAPPITGAIGGPLMAAGLRHPSPDVPAMTAAMGAFIRGTVRGADLFTAFMRARAEELHDAARQSAALARRAKAAVAEAAADAVRFAALKADAEVKEKNALAQLAASKRGLQLAALITGHESRQNFGLKAQRIVKTLKAKKASTPACGSPPTHSSLSFLMTTAR
jgi:hypothetical protein